MSPAMKNFSLSATAGAAVIALAITMSFFYLPSLEGTPAPFSSPILALEFSSSVAEAQALFGEREDIVRKFHIGHYLDMAFLLAYTAFLCFANVGAWQQNRRNIFLFGSGFALVAGAADFAENLLLMQLNHSLLAGTAAPDFQLLRLCVTLKFSAICLAMLCLAPALWRQRMSGKVFTIATVLMAGATALTLAGSYGSSSAMMLLTVIAWGALLLWLLVVLKHSQKQPVA